MFSPEERAAFEYFGQWGTWTAAATHAATLRSLLSRSQVLSQKNDCPTPENAAKQDIFTDEEREAVEWAASCASDREHPAEATLRSLLERMK